MRRREFLVVMAAAICPQSEARAQQTETMPRVGVVGIGSATSAKFVMEALRQGLRSLGYVEGKTITIIERYNNGDPKLTAGIVAELIDLGVRAIVTAGEAVYTARRITATLPIVMAGSGDVVADGLAQSLARPGGNITGTIALPRGVVAKRLGTFKQIVPSLRRAAVLLRKGEPLNPDALARLAAVADAAQVALQPFEVTDAADYEAAFLSASAASIDGFIVTENGQFFQDAGIIAALALKHRQPTIGASVMATNGMLAGYSPDPVEMWRSAARFVDKILKGAEPGDVPIELAATFRMVINLKTAAALGLEIPPAVLASADEVIE